MNQVDKLFLKIKHDISIIQQSKSYRVSLVAKRLNAQVFRGNGAEQRDFFSWILGKIVKRINSKALYEFDNLENVKRECEALENELTDFSTSIVKKNTCQIWLFDELSYSSNYGNSILAEMAKAFNEMGKDVQYACFEDGNIKCTEPVSKTINLQEIKMRDFAAMVKKGAIFIFGRKDNKYQKYIKFAEENKLVILYLDELVEKNDCWIDNASYEPNLKYEMPSDMKERSVTHKNIIVEGIKGDENLKFLNNIAKEKKQYNFYVLQNPFENENCSSNIYFIGIKQKSELPKYYSYSDSLLVLPFVEENDSGGDSCIGRAIAMYKKVIIYTSDKIELPNVVSCSTLEGVCSELDDIHVDISEAEKFSIDHSYYKLCNKILQSKERKISISIVVLNRNNKGVIFRCIDTLLKFNTYEYEIIVVDNDSTDGSYEMLLEKYSSIKNVKIIKNNKNGCSSGRNLGVENSSGEYLFFLDSDQWIIGDHWMDVAIDIMEEHIGIGAVAWNAAWFYPEKLSGLIVDYLPNRGIEPGMLYRTDIGLLATSGFLMKRDLFDLVDGFDEFYDPTCFEDTDLSLKIRNYGYETAYTPYMLIKHLPHQTTKSGSVWHTQLMKRNEEYCKNKWEKVDPSLFEYYY